MLLGSVWRWCAFLFEFAFARIHPRSFNYNARHSDSLQIAKSWCLGSPLAFLLDGIEVRFGIESDLGDLFTIFLRQHFSHKLKGLYAGANCSHLFMIEIRGDCDFRPLLNNLLFCKNNRQNVSAWAAWETNVIIVLSGT
jgi:hypothetical protein